MSMGGLPLMMGKLGRSTPAQIAEKILEECPVRRDVAVMVEASGEVWMDWSDAQGSGELVGVYTRSHDPDRLAEDLECVANERGIR